MFWIRMGKNLGLVSRTKFEELIITKSIEKSGFFDKKWYLEQYPDVKEMNMKPVNHYLEIGWKSGYNPSPRFDNNAYLSMYSDVADAKICPLVHYIKFGCNEGRVPKPGVECVKKSSFLDDLHYILTYPVRVYYEYNELKDEIQKINNRGKS